MMDVLVGAVSPHHQQKEFINNQMTKITDEINTCELSSMDLATEATESPEAV